MGSVSATLAAGWLLLLAALAVLMSQSAIRQTGSNRIRVAGAFGQIRAGQTFCQRGEIVPAGTGAIRAFLYPTTRQRTATTAIVRSEASGAIVARGVATATGGDEPIPIPVRPVVHDETRATICLAAAAGSPFLLGGEPSTGRSATLDRRPLPGVLRIVYLEPRAQSWWSFLPRVLSRMSVGERWSGAEAALLVLLLSLAAGALASWQLARPTRQR